jgi:membrane associated rhomboid family serine protease/Tfp pilus assembly protein PilF
METQPAPIDCEGDSAPEEPKQAIEAAVSPPTKPELPGWLKVAGKTPVVRAILLVNTVVFAAMTGCSGLKSLFIPSSQVLLHFGASSGAATIIDGQYWRIATSAFIHCGLLHLMMNSYVLWDVGPLVEKLFGSRRFIAIYALAALGASLSSLMFNPDVVSVGASGAIFGLLGAMVAFFWCHRSEFPSGFLRIHGKIIGIFIIYGIVYGAFIKGVDNASHIGGLLFGFIAALALMPYRPGETTFTRRDLIATAGVSMYCFALLALDCRVVTANRHVSGDAAYRQAIELLQHNRPGEALPLLNTAAALMPDVASVRWDRARAHMSLGQYDKALKDCDNVLKEEPKSKIALIVRAAVFHNLNNDAESVKDLSSLIELDPNNAMAYNNRAWSLVALGKYSDAVADSNRAIALNRNVSTFYDTRAVALLLTNHTSDAIADLNKAARLKPNDAACAYHLACVYKKLGQADLSAQNGALAKRLGYQPERWEPQL